MLKNKSRFIALLMALLTTFILISPFSFAENEENSLPEDPASDTSATESEPTDSQQQEPVTTEDTENAEEDANIEQPSASDIYQGDLYLFDNNITMDKLVNGNVYLFGSDIHITGQIAGNLYVFGNKVTFERAYIQSSVYICATEVSFNAIANDLYTVCNKLTIPTDCGVYRDLRMTGNMLSLSGIVGRDAHIQANAITLEQDGATGSIYGNFNYQSKSEINIPEGAVQGETKFNQMDEANTSTTSIILAYIIKAIGTIIFTLVIFLFLAWLAPKASENIEKTISKKCLPALGIGILAVILVPIIAIILMMLRVGIPLAFLLIGIYTLLISLSVSITAIGINTLLIKKFKIEKKYLQLLTLAAIALILWAIGYIPYIGILVKMLLGVLGMGILIILIAFRKILGTSKKEANPVN